MLVSYPFSRAATMLVEIPLVAGDQPIPARVNRLAREGARRSKALDCFGFVSSDHGMVYRVLDSLPRGTFCEWGSGMGINTGIAALLGFDAVGIENQPELASASRQLLAEFRLKADIVTGDYLQIRHDAEIYYVYCWPNQTREVEERFFSATPDMARLLICRGAEDVRCKIKSNGDLQGAQSGG